MHLKTAFLAAAGAALLACGSVAIASPYGVAIAVGTGGTHGTQLTNPDFRYVQVTILDGGATWTPTAIHQVYNYTSTINPSFSQHSNDGQSLIVHLPDGAPDSGNGRYDHFAYGAFTFDHPDLQVGHSFEFLAVLYDDAFDRIWSSRYQATVTGINHENHVSLDWQVIPLPTAGLMGLAGLGLMGAYRRRRGL